MPYLQRRAERLGGAFDPWSIETLVEAQRRECAGETLEQIADALALSVADVREHLAPTEMRRSRPERAGVGYSHLKGR